MVRTEGALGAAATLVAIAFALCTLDRWLRRRRPHELAWTISLLMFAIASGSLWLASGLGWDAPTFRVFFLFGAILNVPWLALGTVYLLGGERWGRPSAIGLALVSMYAAGVMTVAPLLAPVPEDGLPKGSDLFGPLPRVLAAVGSGVGAVVVVGGAVLSAWRLRRGRWRSAAASGPVVAPGRLALGNLVIALGTLVLSASGTLAARVGELEAFELTLLIGVSLLFVGFLVATSASSATSAAGTASSRRPSLVPVPPPSAEDAPEDLAAHPSR
jgi:hypothetical protein